MNTNNFEKTTELFNHIKKISFFERLFLWKNIVSLSMDAFAEFKAFNNSILEQSETIQKQEKQLERNKSDLEHKSKEIIQLEIQVAELKKDLKDLQRSNTEFKQDISSRDAREEEKAKKYQKDIDSVTSLRDQLESDRLRIEKERQDEINEKYEIMKQTWKRHEQNVEEVIRSICNKNIIEYCAKEKLPFRGKPDNTIKIANQYIIFDAKSPSSDDLSNFPNYIKNQVEQVKKYIKEENVKKEIFLVVPTNTIEIIKSTYVNMGDYTVYVITKDSLEPIILSLNKISEYEFIEKLTPEEREEICRIIGKFAHTAKRRIQIDSFFADEFIEIFKRCKNLPEDILEGTVRYETSTVLNPKTEKRVKKIDIKNLESDAEKRKKELELQNINPSVKGEDIENIPLYNQKVN